MASSDAERRYKEDARLCDPDDLQGQVSRTVDGEPIGAEQFDMIIQAALNGLDINEDDVLLDLCCGNGVLTDAVLQQCRGGVGVDYSEYLVGVAQQRFSRAGSRDYLAADVGAFTTTTLDLQRFTKALCYGSFAYLSPSTAEEVLRALRYRFERIERVFIGNLPDKARIRDFYYSEKYEPGIEDDYGSAIGMWRTEEEFARLGKATGWAVNVVRMPPAFYAAHYRYDAILTPQG